MLKPSDWADRLILYKVNFSKRQKLSILYIQLAIVIIVPIVLFLLPANFFDKGESVCLSKTIFNLECYACGLTRACMHLIHFDFEGAFVYNLLSFVVMPLLGFIWIKWFLNLKTQIRLFS
jgi:hypothetical protein